ncbi:MAG: hypothetical protein RIR70_342, partial [Pseudomonadota bacterium]
DDDTDQGAPSVGFTPPPTLGVGLRAKQFRMLDHQARAHAALKTSLLSRVQHGHASGVSRLIRNLGNRLMARLGWAQTLFKHTPREARQVYRSRRLAGAPTLTFEHFHQAIRRHNAAFVRFMKTHVSTELATLTAKQQMRRDIKADTLAADHPLAATHARDEKRVESLTSLQQALEQLAPSAEDIEKIHRDFLDILSNNGRPDDFELSAEKIDKKLARAMKKHYEPMMKYRRALLLESEHDGARIRQGA